MNAPSFKIGDFVLNKADGQTYRVTAVDGSIVSASRPGSKPDRVALPDHAFFYAPTSRRLQWLLEDRNIKADVQMHGKDPRTFRLAFSYPGPVPNAVVSNIRLAGLTVIANGRNGVLVSVPVGWLSSSEAELLADAGPDELAADLDADELDAAPGEAAAPDDAEAASFSPHSEFEAGTDPALTATAAEIRRLQAERDELRVRLTHAEATIEDLRAPKTGGAAFPAPLPEFEAGLGSREVNIVTGISASAFERALTDGWQPLHIQFEAGVLNVVFVRTASARPITGQRPPLRTNTRPLPLATLIQQRGVEGAEAVLNTQAFHAGQQAYDAYTAAHPIQSYSLIPSGVQS